MNTVRKLSDIEAAFAYTHALMRGTTQVTTHFTVSGDFEPGHLARTAEQWASRLPVLSLRIEEGGDSLWFCEGPGPQPEQIRQSVLTARTSAENLLFAELNDVLVTGSWLWRLHIVRDPGAGAIHFYFTRNHAISDGHSTGAVVRSFLDTLFGEETDAYDVYGPTPNADELTYGPSGQPEAAHGPMEVRPGPVPFLVAGPWDARGSDFVPLQLARNESQALTNWCKGHGITVNQFFAAALAESFGGATGRLELSVFTAVSLRQRYAESASLPDVGCFINVVSAPVWLDDSSLANHARAYASAFRVADAAWRPPRRDHATIRRAVEEAAAAQASPGICITNVGIVDPALGPHANRVTGYRTVVNRTGANYGVVLHLAMLKGAFAMALAFGTPCMDRSTVEKVAQGLHERATHPGEFLRP